MSSTSKSASWSPVIPGTNLSRIEVIQQMVELYREPNDQGMFRLLRYEVLTVGQIAAIRGLSRQRVYIKMLQAGIGVPKRDALVAGTLHAEHLNAALRAVTVILANPNKLRGEHIVALEKLGSPGVVRHLTGVDVRKGEIV